MARCLLLRQATRADCRTVARVGLPAARFILPEGNQDVAPREEEFEVPSSLVNIPFILGLALPPLAVVGGAITVVLRPTKTSR